MERARRSQRVGFVFSNGPCYRGFVIDENVLVVRFRPMNTADKINLIIALGTIAAAVFAGWSARIAARATRDAAKQMKLATSEIVLHREDLHARKHCRLRLRPAIRREEG